MLNVICKRRRVLELGASALGLSLFDVLRARNLAADSASPPTAGNKSLIVFWTHGGMSQQDTYDMKPEAPAEFRGPYAPIATSAPGVQISERFPRQAPLMDRLSIVRSVNHQNGIHAPSAHWMQTGYFGPTLARNAPQKPSFGSVIARCRGARQSQMPPYVAIPKAEAFGYQGAVYLGAAYNPFELGADPNANDFRVPNLALPKELSLGSVQDRARLLREFDTLRRDIDRSGTLEGLNSFKAQALEMVTGDRVRDAFDLNRETPQLRDRYGRHLYGQSALLARRLIEAGTTCVTINTGYWDHHDDIEKGLEAQLPPLDAAIAALVEDLEARGMLDDVVIFCAGEFGRTPLINGHAGRDHWANCFSVLLGGGGLHGGRIVGASEPRGGNVAERPVSPHDLLATLYHALGIPLDTHFNDATGRPVSIVNTGRPIRELL
ncbi:MAG TPA: DUF1501 domain-containing protein [Pirellulales bacterium]|nr:DUF1501 domain-containing protein [Pirellulales bacterium]